MKLSNRRNRIVIKAKLTEIQTVKVDQLWAVKQTRYHGYEIHIAANVHGSRGGTA